MLSYSSDAADTSCQTSVRKFTFTWHISVEKKYSPSFSDKHSNSHLINELEILKQEIRGYRKKAAYSSFCLIVILAENIEKN